MGSAPGDDPIVTEFMEFTKNPYFIYSILGAGAIMGTAGIMTVALKAIEGSMRMLDRWD